MTKTTAATLVVVALVFAGCIASSSAASLSFNSNAPRDYESQANADCSDQTELTISMIGLRSGSMRVRVYDGDGASVFDETYLGTEGGDDVRSLFGASGEWTLEMTGTAVSGIAKSSISC